MSGLAGAHVALVPQGTFSSGVTTPEFTLYPRVPSLPPSSAFTLSAIIYQGARRSAASGGCSDARVGGVRDEPAGGAANPYGTRPARVLPLDNPRSVVFWQSELFSINGREAFFVVENKTNGRAVYAGKFKMSVDF